MKKKNIEDFRVLGKITSVHEIDSDHPMCARGLTFESRGFGQGFGLYGVGNKHYEWELELSATFGFRVYEQLLGEECYALYNERRGMIIGLESVATGLRFLVKDFFKKHFPNEEHPSALERKISSLKSEIAWAERRAQEAREELKNVEDKIWEW